MTFSASAYRLSRSQFENFPARRYLEQYYSAVGNENAAMMSSIADYLRTRGGGARRLIEIGGGPSLYALLTVVACLGRPLERVVFTDIAQSSLQLIDDWFEQRPAGFDYAPAFDWLEANLAVDRERVAHDVRASNVQIVRFDWRSTTPSTWIQSFDIISSHFFAESVTRSEEEAVGHMRAAAVCGAPHAIALLSFIRRSTRWKVGEVEFPAVPVDEKTILPLLARAGISLEDDQVRSVAGETPVAHTGYEGLFFVAGRLEAADRRPGGGAGQITVPLKLPA